VLVAILEPDAANFSVPSKVLSYLCAARPVLAAIPSTNLASRVITKAEAGLVVDPADEGGFLAAAARLHGDSALRETLGKAGRRYAEGNFSIGPIADRFERLLAGVAPMPEAVTLPA
jgi:glycosyltransferase involved in cell wall biosynthesis